MRTAGIARRGPHGRITSAVRAATPVRSRDPAADDDAIPIALEVRRTLGRPHQTLGRDLLPSRAAEAVRRASCVDPAILPSFPGPSLEAAEDDDGGDGRRPKSTARSAPTRQSSRRATIDFPSAPRIRRLRGAVRGVGSRRRSEADYSLILQARGSYSLLEIMMSENHSPRKTCAGAQGFAPVHSLTDQT